MNTQKTKDFIPFLDDPKNSISFMESNGPFKFFKEFLYTNQLLWTLIIMKVYISDPNMLSIYG